MKPRPMSPLLRPSAELWALRPGWLFQAPGRFRQQVPLLIRNGIVEQIGGTVPAGIPVLDCPDRILIPGLVNAHTHLEFSTLAEPLQPLQNFAEWIRSVVGWRRQQSAGVCSAIEQGLQESTAFGVQGLGEIATSDWWRAIAVNPEGQLHPQLPAIPERLRELVMFREILGLRPEQIRPQLEIAFEHLRSDLRVDGLSGEAPTRLIRGLSPHAPYSVHPELFRRLVELANVTRPSPPVAMHLAETREELELLDQGTGPLVQLLQDFGVWTGAEIPRGTQPIDYLRTLSPLPRVLVIHGNYLAEHELDWLAQRPQFSVVYCPRTHAAMGHPPHPWRRLLERGVRVCLGTDSRASNPDLSIWEELRFLQGLAPDLRAGDLLQLATGNSTAALGIESGRLPAVGSPLAGLLLRADAAQLADPEVTLFQSPFRGEFLAEWLAAEVEAGRLPGG
jgi:cytosine/adenosine deaminase-related metal-dependent hydrolase